MKSWTRTLNLDDAHSLLALAEPGSRCEDWARACQDVLPELSVPRRRELVRLVRDGFLDWRDDVLQDGLFLRVYRSSPAMAQIDLVDLQWAMSHPITLVAVEALVGPALDRGHHDIPLDDVEQLVAGRVQTDSSESLRKTRTVLLGAMEGIGTLVTRGTGQHRSLCAARGAPHPIGYAYLVLRELEERGADGMIEREAVESSLPVRLTQCEADWAHHCLQQCLDRGILRRHGDEITA